MSTGVENSLTTRLDAALHLLGVDTADDQGIKVDPTNEEWTELWTNYKKELGLPPFLYFLGLD